MYRVNNRVLAIIIAAIVITLPACNDDDTGTQDTIPVVDTTKIVLDTNEDVYASWDDFYSKDDIAFSLDSFMKSDTLNGELYIQSFEPDKDYYTNYGPLLVYNYDSSMFIDAYSTAWIIEADKEGQLYAREGEVDQEVTVIDTHKHVKTRLLFCGPSCIIQKAFWYSKDIVGIMGLMSEYTDEYYTPTIWFVNINNGVTIPYQYHSSISITQADDYMVRYLESRGIKMAY